MADGQPSGAINAAFPAPPPFYKSFTPANIANLKAHLETSSHEYSQEPQEQEPSSSLEAAAQPPKIASLPPELIHLVPPLPPKDGVFRLFGTTHNVLPPTTTPASIPTQSRLITLTRSILLTFLSFTHALATAPGTYVPMWETLQRQFFEAHDVVNEYRPHQLRETLIAMMEAQVARCREEATRAREMGERVREVLEGLGVGKEGEGETTKGDEGEGEERRVWEVVKREVGFD